MTERLDFCDGKYSIVFDSNGIFSHALRYGERWKVYDDCAPDNMTLALAREMLELKEKLEKWLSSKN